MGILGGLVGSGTWVKLAPGATGRLPGRKDVNPASKGWTEEVGLAMGVGRPGVGAEQERGPPGMPRGDGLEEKRLSGAVSGGGGDEA